MLSSGQPGPQIANRCGSSRRQLRHMEPIVCSDFFRNIARNDPLAMTSVNPFNLERCQSQPASARLPTRKLPNSASSEGLRRMSRRLMQRLCSPIWSLKGAVLSELLIDASNRDESIQFKTSVQLLLSLNK